MTINIFIMRTLHVYHWMLARICICFSKPSFFTRYSNIHLFLSRLCAILWSLCCFRHALTTEQQGKNDASGNRCLYTWQTKHCLSSIIIYFNANKTFFMILTRDNSAPTRPFLFICVQKKVRRASCTCALHFLPATVTCLHEQKIKIHFFLCIYCLPALDILWLHFLQCYSLIFMSSTRMYEGWWGKIGH